SGVGTGGAETPEDDLGLVYREAVVVGRIQAGRVPGRAVDVGDGSARSANDVVVVVPHAPFEPGRASGRFDAPYETRRSERVEGLVHGLEGDMADTIAHPGGDALDVEMIAVADGFEESHTGGRDPQSDSAQLLGGGLGRAHVGKPIVLNTN